MAWFNTDTALPHDGALVVIRQGKRELKASFRENDCSFYLRGKTEKPIVASSTIWSYRVSPPSREKFR
jgi:hypothetical protein